MIGLLTACGGGSNSSNASSSSSGQTEGSGKVIWSSASLHDGYPSTLTIKAEANPTLPKKEVVLAQAPYNDHSYQSIGIKKGWFEEVGITITPKPMGKSLDMEQMAPALLAGQIEVGTMTTGVWIPAMDQSTSQKIFTYVDTFLGHAVLGNPNGHYKTFEEFHEEGMPFKQALTAAMEQLKGKTWAYSSETSERPFQQYILKESGMSFNDTNNLVLEDPKIVELATGGRADFASPTSGPLVTQLLDEGWTPVVTQVDLVKYGNSAALESSILNDGFAATEQWLGENHATALRMAAVSYKILQYKKEHELQAAKIQIPYLNSIAGTEFTPADSKYLDHVIDPFFTFEEQKEFFENKESPWYYTKDTTSAIKGAEEEGTLKPGHKPDEIILADDTWHELKSLQGAAQKTMKAVAATNPTGKAQKLLAEAEVLYGGFDFLDALRFAAAAEMAS